MRVTALKSGLSRAALAFAAVAFAAVAPAAQAGPFGKKKNQTEEPTIVVPGPSPVTDAAAYYVEYRRDVLALSSAATSLEASAAAQARLAAYDADALSRGLIAYAALVAAETPAFNDGLKEAVDAYGRDQILTNLAQNIRVAAGLPGAEAAAQSILRFAAQDAEQMRALSGEVEAQAAAAASTDWGRARLRNQQQRLARINQAGDPPAPAAPALQQMKANGVAAPVLASAGDGWAAFDPASSPRSRFAPTDARARRFVDQALALATHYALDDDAGVRAPSLTRNDRSKQCFSFAKLNLDQCVAAAGQGYEETFCLGRHALGETSDCLGWISAQGQG